MILNKRGLHCDMAEDGYQAIEMVTEQLSRYHLIFMDNMMPRVVSYYDN